MTHYQFLCKMQRLQKEALKHKKIWMDLSASDYYVHVSAFTHNPDHTVKDYHNEKIFGHTKSEEIEMAAQNMIEFINSVK